MMRLKSPPAKKKASETVAPSGVVKKLKSPPAKMKPTDTGPVKIEEGEPSTALKLFKNRFLFLLCNIVNKDFLKQEEK